MKIDADRVYLYRVEVDRPEAPFEVYRNLAYTAMAGWTCPCRQRAKSF